MRHFHLDLGHDELLLGFQLSDGRLLVIDDAEYGLTTVADSVEQLLAGYGRGEVTWCNGGDESEARA